MTDRPRVILATAHGVDPDDDVDMPILARAVAAAGCEVTISPWDDADAGWADADLAVVRSTWDYPTRLTEFRRWIDWCVLAGVRLVNPAEVLRWNLDKRYLNDLSTAGIPVVPTIFIEPGAEIDLPTDHEYVVKPAMGAGSHLAARYAAGDGVRAVAHVELLHDNALTAMVQPYRHTVDTDGERTLVFLGGQFVHAFRKSGVLTRGADLHESRHPHPGLVPWRPSAEELALGRRALAAVPFDDEPVYGRVDMIIEPHRGPTLMELELIEPNLFLRSNPGSADILAGGLVSTLRRHRCDVP